MVFLTQMLLMPHLAVELQLGDPADEKAPKLPELPGFDT